MQPKINKYFLTKRAGSKHPALIEKPRSQSKCRHVLSQGYFCFVLFFKKKDLKAVLHSTGSSVQCSVMTQKGEMGMGGRLRGREYMYTHG